MSAVNSLLRSIPQEFRGIDESFESLAAIAQQKQEAYINEMRAEQARQDFYRELRKGRL